jgi:hypothetical protein
MLLIVSSLCHRLHIVWVYAVFVVDYKLGSWVSLLLFLLLFLLTSGFGTSGSRSSSVVRVCTTQLWVDGAAAAAAINT